jgi:hypothetical protein
MGKKSATPADVTGAAEKEGQYGKEIARDKTYADRPDQYNALGSSTWGQEMVTDPATGKQVTKWTQNQNLSPEMQDIFDSDMQRNQDLGNQSAGMNDRIQQEMGAPLDWEQFGEGQAGPEGWTMDGDTGNRAEDFAYQRSTNRLDPQMAEKKSQLERQMAGRGLRAGDSAYDKAMQNFDTGSNDAYEQARLGAVGEGMNAHQQQFSQGGQAADRANALRKDNINEYLGKRGQSLKESNALKDSQTTGDTIANFGSGG